jgi:hypothetical protein
MDMAGSRKQRLSLRLRASVASYKGLLSRTLGQEGLPSEALA